MGKIKMDDETCCRAETEKHVRSEVVDRCW